MSYEIKIIGTNDSVTVDNERGMRLLAAYNDDSVPDSQKLNIGDALVTRKGQIRYVRKVEDSASTMRKNNEVVEDVNARHGSIYKSWISKSPRERSRRCGIFKMAYSVIHGTDPSADVLEGLSRDLERFFAENPKRTYGDGPTYADHLGRGAARSGLGRFHKSALSLMERVVTEDILNSQGL